MAAADAAHTMAATDAALTAAYTQKFGPMFQKRITNTEFAAACAVDCEFLWSAPEETSRSAAGRPPMPRPTAITMNMQLPAYNEAKLALARHGYTGWNVSLDSGGVVVTVRLAGWLVVMGDALFEHFAKHITLPPAIVRARQDQRCRLARNLHRQGLRRINTGKGKIKRAPPQETIDDENERDRRSSLGSAPPMANDFRDDLASLSKLVGATTGSPTSPSALLSMSPLRQSRRVTASQ